MISSIIKFGKQLKELSANKVVVTKIGRWAHSYYLDLPEEEDKQFLEMLLHLGTMELGEEFAFSYDELMKIADDLIAGRSVSL